ncbi:MAG TPA: DinB family protein [Acidimicrobiales bacterium]|nr:DinB family protein [Acidimicrobiales bacterium]
MTRSVLSDAFDHHVWATLRIIDAAGALSPEQLDALPVPGVYGPVIETLRHLVVSDRSYLVALTEGEVPAASGDALGLPELRELMVANGRAWTALVQGVIDPEAVVVRHRPDRSEVHAPAGIRLAQALHHGTDHRSQICTILSALAIEPPDVGVWELADEQGRLLRVPPPS